uniref:Chondroadherin-like protein n=1 Tax=Phallusia mammillata TaxID=59560 RepID=A0A6F9D9Z8_9ASCI|nr:chondroadherin-like protein [Phallusia mammillata]
MQLKDLKNKKFTLQNMRLILWACTLSLWQTVVLGAPCPRDCSCNKPKKIVTCSSNSGEIPGGIPPYAQDVVLKGNRIRWLRIGDFTGFSDVVNLLLNGNEITGIEPGTFGSLKRVKLLNLRTNNLTSLDSGMFDGMPKTLKTLYLHENQISTIESGVFRPLAKAAVQILTLKMNKLTEIRDGDFEGLQKLKNLILDDNLIQSISGNAFNTLRNIRKLSLENNKLVSFPTEVKLPFLSTLSLANNKLTSLANDVFSGMGRLSHINLSSNALTSISESTFANLPKLHTLDLSSNRLVSLHDLRNGREFTNLLLGGNMWQCDCAIQVMRRWMETTEYDVTCMSPTEHSGRSLKSLSIEDLHCPVPKSATTPDLPITTSLPMLTNPVITGSSRFYCPAKCVCAMDVRHINCNRRGYTAVPSRLPDTAALVDLRDNKIRLLESNSFVCPHVISLHLQGNGLQRIRAGAFRHLAKLVYLYLNRNQISEIEEGAFEGMETLAYLFLDNNRIAAIPSGLFRPLASIYSIYLRRNYLVALRSDSMEGLKRLRWLYLSWNRLTHIDDDAFNSCPSLNRLYLGNNELSVFPLQALSGLTLLNHLDLSGNFIDAIPASRYKWMTQIQSLDLASNQIHAIEGGFLDKLIDLKSLNVSDNLLRHLPELPTSIVDFNLANNTWTCDCKIGPLWKWMNARQSQAVTCSAPANRVGQNLSTFSLSDFDCNTTSKIKQVTLEKHSKIQKKKQNHLKGKKKKLKKGRSH